MTTTLEQALRAARARLAATSDSPDLDARRLLAHALGIAGTTLITHGERALAPDAATRYEAVLARRAAGEPLAYIVGHVGFWSLDLVVDARVLVPRPDTETLVGATLARLDARPRSVVDLGTGSGAIALALATERPAWHIVATDADPGALACARENAERLGVSNVMFRAGDWYQALGAAPFDAIVSNPPYVAADDIHLSALGHEPGGALIAAENGLADLAHIAHRARLHLRRNGRLLLEHGYQQGPCVRRLLADSGLTEVTTVADLAGRSRVTCGRRA